MSKDAGASVVTAIDNVAGLALSRAGVIGVGELRGSTSTWAVPSWSELTETVVVVAVISTPRVIMGGLGSDSDTVSTAELTPALSTIT